MEQIQEGLKEGLDVEVYNNPLFPAEAMRLIRRNLKEVRD